MLVLVGHVGVGHEYTVVLYLTVPTVVHYPRSLVSKAAPERGALRDSLHRYVAIQKLNYYPNLYS